MKASIIAALALGLTLLAGADPAPHLEVAESHPAADTTLAEPPTEVWLAFTVAPDTARSTFRVVGPDGVVELGDVTSASALVLRADVKGAMPPGVYTVEWSAAPPDDHAVRGRFNFFVDVS